MHEMEWQTRKDRIDCRLRGCTPPWEVTPWMAGMDTTTLTRHAVEEYPTEHGPADYALFVNGQLLGIVEAKKLTVNPQNVLEQAKRYASGATDGPGNWNGLRVPFLYATNGEIIWHLDVRAEHPASRLVAHFHSPEALATAFSADPAPGLQWLRDTPPNWIGRLRDYQRACIRDVERSIVRGRRDLLVAMATGTGKTFLTVSQIYRLLESKLFRRILFLVDRKALAAQAVREFSAFSTPHGNKFTQEYEVFSQRFRREDFGDDDPFDPSVLPVDYLTRPDPSKTFVYVSTIQRMARNLFGAEAGFAWESNDADNEDDADKLDIPIHAFDLIIADECHRGYTAKEVSLWRDTLNHFDAVRIGLTATPAAHTVSLFGPPVFRYGVEQAILDGYLVDYEVVAVKSGVRMNGIFLQEGEQVGKVDTTTGQLTFDDLEDERRFESTDIERRITAPDSNRKIIEEIARHAYAHEEATGRFPKILIFAVNDVAHTSHADQLVRICREVFAQGDDFVQKITGNPNVDRPLQRIREFRNRPNPKVVVTVDMLSTGVDIPALEFIVFMRPVKSRILWEQMLGRGTRRCDEINKSKFVVFDCFDGSLVRYFKEVSNFDLPDTGKPALTLPQVIENIWQNVDRDYHTRILIKRLRRIEKAMSGDAYAHFAPFIPDGDIARFTSELPQRLRDNFRDTMGLLRDPDFQKALEDYPRAKIPFLVATGVVDEVSSHAIERYGDFETPQDYLEAFSAFVRENADQLEALGIVLRNPTHWNPNALESLRSSLMQHRFPEQTLQRAHERAGHTAMADVISIVKHAASEEAPLLTAPQRVERALDRILAHGNFTDVQREWLGYIREHLVSNLSISEEDFDYLPIFSKRGGLARAKKVFAQQLPDLIRQLNEAVAA